MNRYFKIRYELDSRKVLAEVDRHSRMSPASFVCVADGNILTMVHRDEDYRKTVDSALFSICDSSWVPLLLKQIYGIKAPQYCGSQIFDDIIKMKKYTMAFVGTTQTILDALKAQLTKVDPRIGEMLFLELPFKKVEEFDYEAIARILDSASPDIVWLSLGAPKQERFAERLTRHLHKGVIIPVGAVFNFRSGLGIRRAPEWMVKYHLEFVYRLFSEPKKQIPRVWQIVRHTPAILSEEKPRKSIS